MSKDAADSVMRGLEEALAYTEGRAENARVHEVEVPDVDVARIRARTGLSQAQFRPLHRCSARHAAELGARPATSYGSRPGASSADRPPTLSGRGITALIERLAIVSHILGRLLDLGRGSWTDVEVLAAGQPERPAIDPQKGLICR